MSRLHKIAAASIFIALVVLALKLGAWWVTGSIALFSESTESLVNLASALAAFVAVWLAARPADTRHPFGFHKAELLSALFGGTLITLAAVIILREAVTGLFDPQPVQAMVTGLLLSSLGSIINGIWCYVLITEGRKLRSPALQADGRHLLSDVLFSAAVIIGLVASSFTGWLILDPLIAGLVALNVLRTGLSVVFGALRGLLDESLPETELQKIRAVILAEGGDGLRMRDLRTRHAGAATFIEFRLILPGGMTVATAHQLTLRLTHALQKATPNSQITIHIEADRGSASPFSVIDGGRKDRA
ncbi:MAG: cation diffusion facilitator family transporter [Rhodobacteraceae bacterium]|nr:cation diffusion facilitator family transporter [Paracoccaceae bacterium]